MLRPLTARLLALLLGTSIAVSTLLSALLFSGAFKSPINGDPGSIPRDDVRFGSAAEGEAKNQSKEIDQEIDRLGPSHPWAGRYYEGDGLGENVNLELAPRAGFVFTWHGCLGLYDRNFGEIRAWPDRLELVFRFPNSREQFHGLDPVLVFVVWGERHYLVPDGQLEKFCNDVNSGWARERGTYLLRSGDEDRPTAGLPSVPAAYRSLLLEKPVEATLTGIGESRMGDDGGHHFHVTLDRGSHSGLRPRMSMRLVEPSGYRFVKLEKVGPSSCSGDLYIRKDEPPPAVGWRFSTTVWD
jgi:hypothetical protein